MISIRKTAVIQILAFILLFHFQGFGQATIFYISGHVIDATTGKPVQSASVSVIGTPKGVSTDSTGQFSLSFEMEQLPSKLVISHISYFRQEITIVPNDKKNGISVSLEPKDQKLNEVVISATLTQREAYRTSLPVDIVLSREVQERFSSNIVDVLSRTPGFAQVWEYHSPLLLRGMNSNRVLVIKDGARRIGTFPGGYFGQDMDIYDAGKIEVVKGPGSVIYGSGAISGIINVISPELIGEKTNTTKLLAGYGSNNNEGLGNISFCAKNEKSGIRIHGKWRKTGDYYYGDGSLAENSDVEDRDLSLKTALALTASQKVTLDADYHYGNWGKPRGFNGPEKYFTEIRNVENGGHTALSYSFAPKNKILRTIKANVYYDAGSRDYYQYKHSTVTGKKTSLDLVHYKDKYGGGQVYSQLNLSVNNLLTVGVDGYMFRIDSPTDYIDYYNNTSGSSEGYSGAGQQCAGIFANDEWIFSEKLNLVAGIRYDEALVTEGETTGEAGRDITRRAVSGSVGTVFSPAENNHLSLNIGRAFRMPITEELFTQTVSCKGIKKGNPALEPEFSWNFDAGFRGTSTNKETTWDLALFYNLIDNYICESPDTVNEDVDFTYKNNDALLWGGELSLSHRLDAVFSPGDNLFAGFAASYVYGIDKSVDEPDAPLFGIPPFNFLADLKYQGICNRNFITGYFVKVESEYAAAQNRVASVPEGTDGGPWGYITSNAHLVFHLSLGLNSNSLPGKPKVRLIAKNLLNTDYKPFGSYIPAMGRNVKILILFTI